MVTKSTRRAIAAASIGMLLGLARALAVAQTPAQVIAAENFAGWQIPAGAAHEENPLAATPAGLGKGKKLFASNCQKCHGPSGRGDGPSGDPDHLPADLTQSTAPEGIMFYKIWNGRKTPVMPSFKAMMTKEEIWTVIAYARSLRTPSSP